MKLKQSIFYIIAICIPFIILLVTEGVLRLSGYGYTYPLFVPSAQLDGYLQPNPVLVKRYFAPNGNVPSVSPDTFLFTKNKPAGTFRIVTMGGSTMAGFPYGRFGSPAGMLQQRFKGTHPSSNIEIISVAMSSINSYTLLDITEEVIAIDPDAILIYAGHNEYLGIMGVGSVYASKGGHGANLMYLALKEVRLFQLIQSIYQSWFGDEINNLQNNDPQRTVMAQVAKNKAINYNDEVYAAGLEQFTQNLGAILQSFKQANIPVMVGNLVANERDQVPFESVSNEDLNKASSSLLLLDASALNEKTIAQADKLAHADYFYAAAMYLATQKQDLKAHEYFIKAMDYDLLRFRAPSQFNTIIGNSAEEHGATLVDVHDFIHKRTTPFIAYNVMLEHLHPNRRGYFLLSEAFYESLIETLISPAEYKINSMQAWQLSPLTEVDEIYATYKITQLTSDYPFSDYKKKVNKPKASDALSQIAIDRINGATWISTQQALLAYYQKNNKTERAANVAGVLFDAIPNQHNTARVASLLYLRANILPFAKYYALKAVSLNKADVNYRLTLAEIYFKLGNKTQSLATLNSVLAIEPNNQRAKQIKTQISR
jgi:lysophospholipase L1-like esterase